MMSIPVRDFLKNRRDRTLGAILGHAERTLQEKLSKDDWESFRRVVLDAINGYHDCILDLMKAEDGTVRNEEVITLLRSIERQRRS